MKLGSNNTLELRSDYQMIINEQNKSSTNSESIDISQTKRLMKIADEANFWHSPAGDAFATINERGHDEHLEVSGRTFRDWLSRNYFRQTRSAPSSQTLRDVLGALEGRSRFEGETHKVFLRVAYADSRLYIDLGTADWKVVEICSDAWRVISNPPVRFRRAPRMLSLPAPSECEPENAILKLKRFLNLESDVSFQLTLGWIMTCFLPEGSYPILVLHGEQGTGKSTFVRIIRSLVDPNESPLRKAPRNTDDLMASALGNHVVGFDNVSLLSDELSDDLCRLATGSGLAKRSLYTNSEETVLSAKRPCILNGIDQFVSRGDLADRSISICLPVISEEKRSREETFWIEFETSKPEIFGAICSAIQQGLKDKDTFEMPSRPRMADAFHWISATETAFGWKRFTTFDAFKANQDQMAEDVIASSPLFSYIEKYARLGFRGPAELLLSNFRGDCNEKQLKYLPGNAASLGNRLRRLAPALRRLGVEIEFLPRTTNERLIFMRKKSHDAVIPVMPS